MLAPHEALGHGVVDEPDQAAPVARHVEQTDRLGVDAERSQVNVSNSSSSVPVPPGRQTNPSERSIMVSLRSCIDSTTWSSVSD